jgi:hypothetical protein
MPVVLAPQVWDEWLGPRPLPAARLAELMAPAPDDLLTAYPVGTAVNSARHDGPELTMRAVLGAAGAPAAPVSQAGAGPRPALGAGAAENVPLFLDL